jgi:hypothetical protein
LEAAPSHHRQHPSPQKPLKEKRLSPYPDSW